MVSLFIRVEVILSCDIVSVDYCEVIRKALEPDNNVEGLKISFKCVDGSMVISISGEKVGSVRAAYNDILRALSPLIKMADFI